MEFKENYSIPWEEAKKMDCYNFRINEDEMYDYLKNLPTEKLSVFYNLLKSHFIYKDPLNTLRLLAEIYDDGERIVVAVLEFGNIDIEINIERSYKTNKTLSEYFCCVRYSENYGYNGWESDDYTNDYMIDFQNQDELEKHMYECLMKHAERNHFFWSIPNPDPAPIRKY